MLSPADVESFALVSKTIYVLAIPFLRDHRKLKAQYSNFDS